MPIEHDVIPLGEIHIPHNWEYADAAARTGATGFVAADVGKWAKQLDNATFWELTATTPTWAQRTGAGALANDSITNGLLANMATQTIKGRTTAGTGDPEDLTATQATAILNAVVGDSGSGGTKGLVPAPGAGDAAAGKFLKADGTFAVPSGTGAETGANSDITSMDGLTGAIENPTKIIFPEAAAPSTPGANKVVLYAKSDGLLYSKDDAGVETVVTGGGGGGISGLTTDKIPIATSSTTIGDGPFQVVASGLQLNSNDLCIPQSIRNGTAATPSIYIGGNVSAAGGINCKNNQNIGWTSGSDATATQDTGFSRNAVGMVEINDGTPISATDETHLRDLFLRQIYLTQTITAGGTTGNQTINKAAGTVNIAAAGTSVTVTNSLVSTSSIVLAVIRTNDSTAWIKNVVPGSGSFTINLGAAATAEISIGFIVINK